MPSCRKTAVRRAVPAKNFHTKRGYWRLCQRNGSVQEKYRHLLASVDVVAVTNDHEDYVASGSQVLRRGGAHESTAPPAAASRQPVAILNGQHSRCPSGPSSDLPMRSLGTFGPRPLFLLLGLSFAFAF